MDKKFLKFLANCTIYFVVIILLMVFVNNHIDAARRIHPQHMEMARLALAGNIVATPQNYNERVYQVCIVNQMETLPETVVIGSSRGMFLGEEITGYNNLYNNCVSGAGLEDDYALLGLYYNRFGKMPHRVIIETSPWVLYGEPESRWIEDDKYSDAVFDFYEVVNGEAIKEFTRGENPYISLPYFQYNIIQFVTNGIKVSNGKEEAKISTDISESADYPDGTIRYEASLENESESRLEGVKKTQGACTYQDADIVKALNNNKIRDYESLIDYLLDNGCEVIIYLQPFSVTQCEYSIDQKLNPGFELAEEYINDMVMKRGIVLIGGYDARWFGLTDARFIDYMHLDKLGTEMVWNYK